MKRFTLRASVVCAFATGLTGFAQAYGETPFFNACVSYPSQSAGIYSFPTTEYAPTLIKRDVFASGGGIANDTYYFSTRYEELGGLAVVERKSYSLKSWGFEDSYSGKIEHVATDLAYFAPRDEAYGCFCNATGSGYIFAKYKIGNWGYDKICDLGMAFAALDFSADGTLYAIDWGGTLNKVNKKTGELTPVGTTGLTTSVITGGAIDRKTDTFYFSVKNETESAIYTVNLENASAQKAYTLENEEQVGGMYFPEVYESDAPGTPYGNPTLNFNGTALNGTIKFRAPRTTYGGSPASGVVTYHVQANGDEIATGEAEFGSTTYITADITLPEAGQYCFSVYFENEAGRGPRTKVNQFVGPDTPKTPLNPRLTYTDGTIKLFWSAAGYTGINGGTIDRTNFHYRVTRYPDGTTYTCDASPFQQELAPTDTRVTYRYSVEAVAGELASAPAYSPEFGLGPIEPSFDDTFSNNTSAFEWSSHNPDGSQAWSYDSGYMSGVTNKAPADNYLVSPPFVLKAGNKYDVAITMKRGNNNVNETFTLCAGKEKTAEALALITVIEETEISTSDYQTYTGCIEPESDGIYYFALHATSPAGKYMCVNRFSVAKGVATSAPGAVTDLTAHPDMTGAHKASFTFTTPTTTLEGQNLTEITAVELLRGDVSVKTVEGEIATGTEMTIADETEPEAGFYDYTVVCHNSAGQGTPATVNVCIGFNQPLDTEKVTVEETDEPGMVTISWVPVTHDIDGKEFAEGDVTYNLYNRDDVLVKGNMTETTYSVRAGEPNVHTWAQYRVYAISEGGVSEGAKSMLVPVGKADVTPWRESFANKEVTYPIGTTINTYGDQWQIVGGFHDDKATTDVDPVDNDGGMMGLETVVMEETVSVFTGKIDLSPTPSPVFYFYLFNYVSSNGLPNGNVITVQVYGQNDHDFQTLREFKIGETGPQNQWNKVSIPLTDYEGQTVRLRIQARVATAIYVHLDNLNVNTLAANNLSARNITAPASVEAGKEFEVKFTVQNTGETAAANYRATLLMNGEEIDSKQLQNLEPGNEATVAFTCTLNTLSADEAVFTGRVELDGDMIEADNTTPQAVTLLRRNGHPNVTNLRGETANGKVELTWDAPDLSKAAPEAATETFESSKGWTSEVDGWKFLDLDRATIGGIGKKEIPVSGQQSFFLMNNTHSALSTPSSASRYTAHSGNQYLCSMYSMRGQTYVQSDDWAISPELYGGPQVISLWASSFKSDDDQPQYLETFEILASTSGTEPEDFTLVCRNENVPAQWTRYEAYLPAGTKHFAIRCISYDKYMLFVDDVEFVAAGNTPRPLTVSGYNIWRDGVNVDKAPASATGWTDATAEPDKLYRYAVTTLYNNEETSSSDDVTVDTSSLGIGNATAGNIAITTTPGRIIVTGAEGVELTLTTTDGKTLQQLTGEPATTLRVVSGIYILRCGQTTHKVAVR